MIVDGRVSKIVLASIKNNIYKVFITVNSPIKFIAGQFVMVTINGKKCPFSIANCPTKNHEIELHIGSSNKDCSLDIIEYFVDALVEEVAIELDAPHGNAWLRSESNNPLLLIAGGTGLSYINSILTNCLNRNIPQDIYLYWGVKNSSLLYEDEELLELSLNNKNLHYIPVIEDKSEEWIGKKGTVLDAVMEDFTDLAHFDIYVCGPFMMAKTAKEKLIEEKKAKSEQMFADAFAYV
ncbi:flavin mononucleotide reductase LuxG [Aliivibrio fischeri]|uniref:Probable flavin reductase n=2 Tax=Aliivibrio fischeri TaxID=668 RepID=LUXG_ALIFS|nr:NAD(P)H-flavin reductase [Aliivibrio fischeri]P24273.1 RecName: Full=Probable flavin reductase [Aliivibrio fischeri]AAA27536.1 LuxG [Aliivibrio fischeri]USR97935.1 NAD(P)H-flavin reductase [Aliivibrio fischeri ATCC 7744 = JCM 18803 = DSM 507]GGK20426.1 NAD(P)H-flavin reductase [Aliivibrio fischeri]